MADAIVKVAPLALGEETAAAPPDKGTMQKLATAVRAFATRATDAAWQRLDEEVQVQTLVWKSIAVSKRGGMGAKEQALRLSLQAALRELAAEDRRAALGRLEEILKTHDGCLSTSMLKNLQGISRQTGLTVPRQQLADRLDAMTATMTQTEADQAGLLKKVVLCRLAKSLDCKVREAFQLPPREEPSVSKENQKEVKEEVDLEFKPLVIATPSRTLYEVVGMMGAVGPRLSTRSTGSVSNANWSTGSVGGAAGAKPTFSNMSTLSTLTARGNAQSDWQPLSPEASAAKLRSMASANPPATWKRLQSEYDTQKLVWESVKLTQKIGTKHIRTHQRIESLKVSIEHLLTLSSEGHGEQEALSALEQLLTRAEDVKLLNTSLSKTCHEVLKQHRLAPQRRALAGKLDVAGLAATLPSSDDDKQQVEELVLACELEGDQLNYSVRRWLRLPIPEEIEAALAAAGKLTLGQTIGVAAARKLSNKAVVGALASRKDSLRSTVGGLAAVEVVPVGAKEAGCMTL